MEEDKIFLGPIRIIESPYVPEDMIFLGNVKAFEYEPKITIRQSEVPWKMQMIIESRFSVQTPEAGYLLLVNESVPTPGQRHNVFQKFWHWFRKVVWVS